MDAMAEWSGVERKNARTLADKSLPGFKAILTFFKVLETFVRNVVSLIGNILQIHTQPVTFLSCETFPLNGEFSQAAGVLALVSSDLRLMHSFILTRKTQ